VLRRLLILLALFLVIVLVAADRVGAIIAAQVLASKIKTDEGLAHRPDVTVGGFPFLTQAVRGRYRGVRIQLTAEQLGQPAGTRADVSLQGVHVPLSDALSGSVQQIPVDRVDGTATLSYALLADQLGGDTTLAQSGDGIQLTKSVEVLGFDFPVTAAGTVTLDGQDVVIDVHDASAGAVDVPAFVLDTADQLLDFRYRVPALPFGLQLTGVQPAAGGVDVRVQARDAVLSG
jgi:hypothetical protein